MEDHKNDEGGGGVLRSVLETGELETIADGLRKKIEHFYQQKFEEFLTAQALSETRKFELENLRSKYEQQLEELTLRAQDEASKFHSAQQGNKQLQMELEDVKEELQKAKVRLAQNDADTGRFRNERNEAVNERDTLLSAVQRKSLEVDRLQADVLSLEQKLKSANASRCSAQAKLEEIESKEYALDLKEKRMDRELTHRDNQIAKLTQDHDRAQHELQMLRRDQNIRSLTVDTKLSEKTEELKLANQTIAHLSERSAELSTKVDELALKLKKQTEEASAMMDHYRKQLESQNRLCELLQQNSTDQTQQTKELENAVTELRRMLEEASESCGALETEKKQLELKHADELAEKERTIGELQEELKRANELLAAVRRENTEQAIERLAPSAAATSRMIQSGMSLTEVYTLYVRTAESHKIAEKENEKLKLQLRSIMSELEESAPKIARQETEYQIMKDSNQELTMELQRMIRENAEHKSEKAALHDKLRTIDGLNRTLQQERVDLSRQIVHLLDAMQRMHVSGSGHFSQTDQSLAGHVDANELITRKLITFNEIEELQSNNIKLLMMVRDLSSKLETIEQIPDTVELEAALKAREERIGEQQKQIGELERMLQVCKAQRDRYQKRFRYSAPTAHHHHHTASMANGDESLDDPAAPMDSQSAAAAAAASTAANAAMAAKVSELEEKLQERHKELVALKDEYDTYRREKHTNDKMMNEHFDKMRTEIQELSSENVKLVGSIEFNAEQNRIMMRNAATHKKQIATLEERARNYEATIAKHEATIMYLKDEAMSAQSKLARAEVQLENLKAECRILKDNETRLQTERQIWNRDKQNQNILLNNLEMIKVSMERSENEGRLRLETRLDETSRECSALRRRLQEEQDRFREQTALLQRQTDSARRRMEEEVAVAETVQVELKNARDELEIKGRKIDELHRKLQETMLPNDDDNPVTQANKRVRELEQQLESKRIELEALQTEVATAKGHVQQYAELAEASEKELKELNELYTKLRETSESDLATLRKAEAELSAQVCELKTQLSLKITGAQLSAADGGDRESELHKAQLELRGALEKLDEQNRELRETRIKHNALHEQLQQAEQKYSNEMVQHSSDIQQLTALKDEMQRQTAQFEELREARDRATDRLKAGEESWANQEQRLRADITQLEERVNDLNAQNGALHDQLQGLSMRLSVCAAGLNESTAVVTAKVANSETDAAEAAEESMTVADSSLLNRSVQEDEKVSVEQLLQIIKYLRKEKDIAMARFDLLRSENVRVQTELMSLQKKLDEAQSELAADRERHDAGVVTAAKHEEILRKLDTYNAITDSNRVLREERDGLAVKVRELSQRLLVAEDELFPLQEKVRELTVKIESATTESTTLRTEAARWRQRASLLIERSNKTNPDDWKRLQSERENLAKMLTNEKELLKRANDELGTLRLERTRLETELATVARKLSSAAEETRSLLAERDTLQQSEELAGVQRELTAKEAQLTDAKNKEQQIRKIAKRYKESYSELLKEMGPGGRNVVDGSSADGAAAGNDASEGSSATATAQLDELRTQMATVSEEMDLLRKENELLRAKMEKADRSQDVSGEKQRIAALMEQKGNLVRELATVKTQLVQVREEQELLKAQYEARLARYEKESADAERESKETISRLGRENEQLTNRLHQLMARQAKPTTSAGVGAATSEKVASESPRTANVKPMAGPSSQQSATVTPRRVSETPLASIRPMAVGSRTAAVLPTSQTANSNVAIVQGSSSSSSVVAQPSAGVSTAAAPSSAVVVAVANVVAGGTAVGSGSGSGSVVGAGSSTTSSGVAGSGPIAAAAAGSSVTTALVPPQQQVHTTASSSSSSSSLNETIASSSPTSSHTDYMPATSSASVAVAAVPPMGSATTSSNAAESSSSSTSVSTMQLAIESDSMPQQMMAAGSDQGQQQPQHQPQAQAAVAMVLPHVEVSQQQQQQQLATSQPQSQQQQQQPSTAQVFILRLIQTSQLANLQISQQQASSSSTVTTTQAGHKRPRDVEGDSSTDTVGQPASGKQVPAKKRLRMQQGATGEAFQGVSGSRNEVEYQVPTSSQRDQEDDTDVIVVDSEGEVEDNEADDVEEEEEDIEDDEDEDDVGMVDEGTAEADDGPLFGDGYEVGESYEAQEERGGVPGVGNCDEGEGPNIDDVQLTNNEVDVDDELRNGCGSSSSTSATASTSAASSSGGKSQSSVQPPSIQPQVMDTTMAETTSSTSDGVGTLGALVVGPVSSVGGPAGSSTSMESSSSTSVLGEHAIDALQQPQTPSTTTSGSAGEPSSLPSVGSAGTTARQVVNPLSRQQQQAAHLMLIQQQQQQQQNYDESADDRIVPSTPTLYATRRTDGFSEAVSSPHPQVPSARFTFAETSSRQSTAGVVPSSGGGAGSVGQQMLPEGIDETRIDLSQLDDAGGPSGSGRSVPTTPQHTSHSTSMLMEHATPLSSGSRGPACSSSSAAGGSGGGESQVPDLQISGTSSGGAIEESTSGGNGSGGGSSSTAGLISTSGNLDTTKDEPVLESSTSSEAQASSATSDVVDRSEKELLEEEEEDDDDDEVMMDGGSTSSGTPQQQQQHRRIEDDVDMDSLQQQPGRSSGSGKHSAPESVTATGTTAAVAVPGTSGTSSPAVAGMSTPSRTSSEADDGVTSEGEKLSTSMMQPMDESSEADVLETPSNNTRSRSGIPRRAPETRRERRFSTGKRGGNRTPITWSEGRALNRGGPPPGMGSPPHGGGRQPHFQPPPQFIQQQMHMQHLQQQQHQLQMQQQQMQQQQQQQQQQQLQQQPKAPRGRGSRRGRGRPGGGFRYK
ncbi:nucleoprotein TPR [Anopheles bellator]|uniref:nucleoprotein TPR n=1 Tax=Anopheles bellator TaxID=139047 RepID=UPI002647885D|nr:nucleoprotein TPR [Anopheles bellator]